MFVENPVLDALTRGVVFTPIALFWVILLVRLIGLRAFSKMTNFDFVATLATASLLANAASAEDVPALVQAATAVGALFLIQFVLARARQRSSRFEGLMDNTPRFLFRDGKFLDDALKETRVSRSDIIAKMRGSSATGVDDVYAVVFETTGDISILLSDATDPRLLDGVR